MNIFVGNLAFTATEERYGSCSKGMAPWIRSRLMTDRDTGRPRGFGFVAMPDATEAQAAIAGLNGTSQGGRGRGSPLHGRPKRLLPRLEGLVHHALRHGQQVIDQLGQKNVITDFGGFSELVLVRNTVGSFHDAVVIDALGLDEEPLAQLGVLLGFKNFRQAQEVICVTMGDKNALHRLRFSRSRSAEATREIARKELVVAAVNRMTLPAGFDHRPSPC